MPSVVSSAVVLNTTDGLSSYSAASAFVVAGGAGRILLAFVQACQGATGTTLSATANGAAMTEVIQGGHSGGGSRPVHGIFAIPAETAGSFAIAANLSTAGRSCTIVCAEIDGADIAALVGAIVTREATDGIPARTLVPTTAGSLLLSVQSTRRGTGSPFTPLAGVTEIADLTTGATATNDHSAFVGSMISGGATEHTLGADDASGNTIDTLFSAVEVLAAGSAGDGATSSPAPGGSAGVGMSGSAAATSSAVPGASTAVGGGLSGALLASSNATTQRGDATGTGFVPTVASGAGVELSPGVGAAAALGAGVGVFCTAEVLAPAGAVSGSGATSDIVRETAAQAIPEPGAALGVGMMPGAASYALPDGGILPPRDRIVAVSVQVRVASVAAQNRIVRA